MPAGVTLATWPSHVSQPCACGQSTSFAGSPSAGQPCGGDQVPSPYHVAEDRGHARVWSGVVCHGVAECPDGCGAPLQAPLFQAIDVEPHETAQVVLNHSVEQADDLTGRPGARGDARLRDEDRLAREAPDQPKPLP